MSSPGWYQGRGEICPFPTPLPNSMVNLMVGHIPLRYGRGVARNLGCWSMHAKCACKILSHAHLLTDKVKVQVVIENAF